MRHTRRGRLVDLGEWHVVGGETAAIFRLGPTPLAPALIFEDTSDPMPLWLRMGANALLPENFHRLGPSLFIQWAAGMIADSIHVVPRCLKSRDIRAPAGPIVHIMWVAFVIVITVIPSNIPAGQKYRVAFVIAGVMFVSAHILSACPRDDGLPHGPSLLSPSRPFHPGVGGGGNEGGGKGNQRACR